MLLDDNRKTPTRGRARLNSIVQIFLLILALAAVVLFVMRITGNWPF